MSQPGKAIFLSYASQDAETVKRICDALRAAGIEVWFDQNELVGGDAWDTKIRRQIAECALFLPVISAHTQARLEGYFRLEWKLAAQRTHTMAEEKAFLLPLVIDGTRDTDARVPAEFKAVQWTRLPGGETPAAFVERVRQLLAHDEWGAAATTAPAPASVPAPRNRRWVPLVWAIFGVAMGLFWVVRPMWLNKSSPRKTTTTTTEAAPAPAANPPATAKPTSPKFAPERVVLTRFENLTGDASLDALARVFESELVRGFGAVQHARVMPSEVVGRAAGRTAAREAGAASFVVGSFVKNGAQIELSAEVVLTADGDLFGTAGPISIDAAAPRGPGLTELVERLATGVSNVVITLQNPPTRISAVIYNRPWPRYPVAARLQAMRADSASLPADTLIAQYRSLLAEAPELLKVKHDLASQLRNTGRFDEAQKIFRELLRDDRPRLAEAEILSITYDEALLAGDPDRALGAAKALVEIRPRSDAITQVIACLWAQNRPRAAVTVLNDWWKNNRDAIPASGRGGSEAGIYATEALMYFQNNDPKKALEVLDALERSLDGQPFSALPWLRFVSFGALGDEAAQLKLIADVGARVGSARLEPVTLQWLGYSQALHLGKTEVAQRWLAAAVKSWDELEKSGPLVEPMISTGIWINLSAGRLEAAEKYLAQAAESNPAMVNVVGTRALIRRAQGRLAEAASEEKKLESWEARNSRGLPAYWRARIAAAAGERDKAVELLRQSISSGLWFGGFNSPSFNYGRVEPEFAPLRGYPPYEELLRPKG